MSDPEKQQSRPAAGHGPTADLPGVRLVAGSRIGHFRIERPIGQGGMGVVYLARDVALDRSVAIKSLPPAATADSTVRLRLKREAKVLASLNHPNISGIYDQIDETEDATYLVLEYVPGQTLADRIGAGRLELKESLSIAHQVAVALAAAHEHGVIHRDLKPDNIKITPQGMVKVLDFGLAKAMEEVETCARQSTITQPGRIMGTPAYMSPEQAAGDPVDERTDIWSLGVVIYEMLTGEPPFKGATQQALIHGILHDEPELLTRTRKDAPPALERLVSAMMQKHGPSRPGTMATVVEQLEAIRRVSVGDMAAPTLPPSIAILPFVDMSPGRDQEYFCDGMAEELINALTQLKDLRVIARTSAFSYKGRDVDVRDIGRELNVASILEGSVRKAGNRLRITAQLVDAAGGHHIWSERYDRDLDDVFAIQDEITLAIVEELKPTLLGQNKARLAKARDVDIEAYQLYLRGRFFWNKRGDANLKKAIAYFEQALEREPDYAPAYAGLAMSYVLFPVYCYMRPNEALPKAREMVARALQIDPANAEAYASRGFIESWYDWDWAGADNDFKWALELNPGSSLAHHWYGLSYLFRGRFDRAVEMVKQALALDPLSVVVNREVGMFYYYARRYDQALVASKKTAEMDPQMIVVHLCLGAAYFGKGMYHEALSEFVKEIADGFSAWAQPYACATLLKLERLKDAQSTLDRLLEQAMETYIPASILGYTHIVVGRPSEGFAYLEKGYEQHDQGMCWIKVLPLMDGVRSDPRYIRLLKKMNLVD